MTASNLLVCDCGNQSWYLFPNKIECTNPECRKMLFGAFSIIPVAPNPEKSGKSIIKPVSGGAK